jgi:branched-chain amino acid transport system substrate-binding protein
MIVRSTILLLIIALAGPAASLSALENQLLKIALQAPLTGEQAAKGTEIRQSVQLAIDQASADLQKLGYNIKPVAYDDQNLATTAQYNAHRLTADKEVIGVIGHATDATALAAAGEYNQGGLPYLSPLGQTNNLTNQNLQVIFRLQPRDDAVASGAVDFALQNLKAKQLMVLSDKNPANQAAAAIFRDRAAVLGLKLSDADYRTNLDNNDLTTALGELVKLKPDAVYFAVDPAVFVTIVAVLAEHQSTIPVMISAATVTPETFTTLVPFSFPLYLTAVPTTADQFPAAAGFFRAYQERYRQTADLTGLYSYAAAQTLLGAIAAPEPVTTKRLTREILLTALRTNSIDAVTGAIEFDAKGDLVSPRVLVYQFNAAQPLANQKLRATINLTAVKPLDP